MVALCQFGKTLRSISYSSGIAVESQVGCVIARAKTQAPLSAFRAPFARLEIRPGRCHNGDFWGRLRDVGGQTAGSPALQRRLIEFRRASVRPAAVIEGTVFCSESLAISGKGLLPPDSDLLNCVALELRILSTSGNHPRN